MINKEYKDEIKRIMNDIQDQLLILRFDANMPPMVFPFIDDMLIDIDLLHTKFIKEMDKIE